ncbi:hypothetical protein C9374_012231 [Naegleria lovaniensis]|uniref:Centrosomal protein 43 n=1 Tax=Naegleria lovaniensis TaxID=51637 RepID=A0AA88G7S4_NAELO|nr:uncharacterized protein C9374_012231 [Naegleria lovaniensis]KAG2373365.1 hypothetical protein C9374_012231 [Naegleria lovaniensis]
MSLEEIKDVLKENLEKRGVLNKIRANLRAEIFKSFEQSECSQSSEEFFIRKEQNRPRPSEMQFLINELIIEYLEYNHFDYSASVFKKECNQPEERLEHRFLAHELNLRKTYEEIEEEEENQETIPLLFKIIHKLRNENLNEKRMNSKSANTTVKQVQKNKLDPTKPILQIHPPPTERVNSTVSNNQKNQPATFGNVPQKPKPKPIPLNDDLDSSSITTNTDDSSTIAGGGMDPFAAKRVSDILQNSNKLSKLQPRKAVANGMENRQTQEPQKSSRIFKPQNHRSGEKAPHSDFDVARSEENSFSSCDNSEFEIGPPPKNKVIMSGLPPPFKSFNDSSMTGESDSF